jgi:hypothetical protein
MEAMRGPLLTVALAAAAVGCKFDPGGVGGDDDDDVATIDADPGAIDADPGAPDSVPPDSMPPDGDADGVRDSLDNCPAIANAGQEDEDADLRGDVCDNCPHISNFDQLTTVDGDLVGDACDPHPTVAGDTLLFFDGFNGSTLDAGWSVEAGGATWTVAGGKLHQNDLTREVKILVRGALTPTGVTVDTAFTPTSVPPSDSAGDTIRSAGVVTADTGPTGQISAVADQLGGSNPSYAIVESFSGAGQGFMYLTNALTTTRYTLRTTADSATQTVTAVETGGSTGTGVSGTAPVAGAIGLRVRNIAVDYEYVVVFTAPTVASN